MIRPGSQKLEYRCVVFYTFLVVLARPALPLSCTLQIIYEKGGSQKGYPPFLILKTLSKKLYMTNITPPQMRTATCCVLGSAIRGTLRASEMVAKDRRPSIEAY
jgi:hypothetical protein